jgi:hypothetical protein
MTHLYVNDLVGSYGQQGQYGQGMGSYGQYGQGMGSYGQYGQGMGGQYSPYYNQNPGFNSFYSGYQSGGYNNRPGYASNYNPSMGSYGGYFYNGAPQQRMNMFTIVLSSLVALSFCFIAM